MNKRFIKKENNILTNIPMTTTINSNILCLNKITGFQTDASAQHDNSMCRATSVFDNKLKIVKTENCQTSPIPTKNIYNIPIGIFSADILTIYEIDSIDSLYMWIDNNLIRNNIKYDNNLYTPSELLLQNNSQQYNLNTINRVLKCWLKINFDILKTYNNFLEKIINKIINIILKPRIIEQILNLNKETKDFINYWIEKNKSNEKLNYDLLNEYLIYLDKKYKIY
jgi:hypothetical protein